MVPAHRTTVNNADLLWKDEGRKLKTLCRRWTIVACSTSFSFVYGMARVVSRHGGKCRCVVARCHARGAEGRMRPLT